MYSISLGVQSAARIARVPVSCSISLDVHATADMNPGVSMAQTSNDPLIIMSRT